MEVEYADCVNVSLKLFELSFKLYEDFSFDIRKKKNKAKRHLHYRWITASAK